MRWWVHAALLLAPLYSVEVVVPEEKRRRRELGPADAGSPSRLARLAARACVRPADRSWAVLRSRGVRSAAPRDSAPSGGLCRGEGQRSAGTPNAWNARACAPLCARQIAADPPTAAGRADTGAPPSILLGSVRVSGGRSGSQAAAGHAR
ncbi:hypothetical protein IscW_ISCW004066 [Ixodes scapularis]|uniref:Secreted protein n=1 Tax=Ixodes scapularis TaxID=6945 RepID=B7PK73_IXOSC|nr:hypothetical protein IscW_ISCW004066 [Ixodes scapularis]|eukprot:XP_002409530.1 hypothetical protein IscW_ISCW004066 [Ixodes scapularis]